MESHLRLIYVLYVCMEPVLVCPSCAVVERSAPCRKSGIVRILDPYFEVSLATD